MSSPQREKLLFLDMDGVIVDFSYETSARWGDIGFWETLQKTPWADDLVALATSHYFVHVLSSLGGGSESATGKMRWLNVHFPQLVRGTILTKKKHLLAQGERVLVDDDPENCMLFRLWDGDTIQVPHPRRFPNPPNTIEEVFKWLVEHS
jgi:5'(3')-deoxyribonucleotidase